MATSQLVNADTIGDFTDVQPEKLRVRGNPRKGIISVRAGFTRPGTPNSASPRLILKYFYCHDCICGTKYHITILIKENEVNLRASGHSQTRMCYKLPFLLVQNLHGMSFTTIITLGCPINPVIDFGYGRKCLRKLVQVRNAVRLTQRLFMKTPIKF